ncbi:MAG: redox-active disulfide protein 2 [uncultured bacterium]|nr:MAG: redox-active disulfide protein 2 [uncultured bacterium]KKP68655.1 MAG: Redox-active disulfide protein 2 [Candidatus Moranbacteria bacterium GW2011_GWE1_35_17]KKP85028.1 MAG: Redox-active disulfide protein 2 [Candidatus Moranbacteria bacterium GW2011_GWF2_35_54]
MEIKILGTGCPNCQKLEANVKQTLAELKIEAVVEKVTDIGEIMSYGVMGTPALVVNEEVRVYGRVPDNKEIEEILMDKNQFKANQSSGCCSCCG